LSSWLVARLFAIVCGMSLVRNALGAYGERWAVNYLVHDAGMRVLDRNWRCEHGELDIVVRDDDAIVFVEVKTRRDWEFGPPAEAVVAAKQLRLRRLAAQWLAAHPVHAEEIRFDVVSVMRPPRGPALIEHIQAAF
jgi:putative endonuclease